MPEVIVSIPTTPTRRKRLEECIKAVQENSSDTDYGLYVFENTLGGWVPAVREMMKAINPDQLTVVIGDDCLPQPEWLSRLTRGYLEAFPDKRGLGQPNDGIWAGKIASYPMATAGFLRKWLYSGYIHNFADNELADVARSMDAYCYVETSSVFHKNHNVDESLYDETYSLQEKSKDKDAELYKRRKAQSGEYTALNKIPWDE